MELQQIDARIVQRGREFFKSISGEAPSIFNKSWWTGKVMDWSMKNEDFKVKLFRFVDVYPFLQSTDSLTRHIEEYFTSGDGELPSVMKYGLLSAGLAGRLGGLIMAKAIGSNIEKMGRLFIVGENAGEAVKNLGKLRKGGFAFTIDVLGEATVSDQESDERLREHLEVLSMLGEAARKWKPIGAGSGALDWGHAPLINFSVKPSAFYPHTKPRDFEGSVRGIVDRIAPVYRKVIELEGFLGIDMESLDYKDITIEAYKQLRSSEEFRSHPRLGLVLQAYLKSTDQDVAGLLAWARRENLPISVRLVKGAYWDYETIRAKQHGRPVPVYTVKADTDASFERNAALILENADICHLSCASHNVRTISAVMETAAALKVAPERYEFQVLYGMAEPVRKGLLNIAGRVRLYCPYGKLIPGMAYLVRRLLENTANESFLRQSFASEADIARLMEDPVLAAERDHAAKIPTAASGPAEDRFQNEPSADFTLPEVRQAFPVALASIRTQLGRDVPLFIDGRDVATDDKLASVNPAAPAEVVARVCQAGIGEVDLAIRAAKDALPSWRKTSPADRAAYLFKAADIARKRMVELAAWQVLEVGKQWDQAHADVAEAIDFLEYYGREMVRLGATRRMGRAPGEMNLYRYRSKGIAAVIAPWNFPLAIALGMTSAALVTGNCVLFKPSSLSARVGRQVADLFNEAGLPRGVLNYLPGRSSIMGDHLIEHPDTALIAFTGSMEVGAHIMKKAAQLAPGQRHIKKVVAEMGGKNAIIIDDDAELDEAVQQVIYAAFGYQGQKCSACSRVIVLENIYAKFVGRLVEAARSLRIGPAEDPANDMGPVVDGSARDKVLEYARIAEQEGRILLRHEAPEAIRDQGFYAPIVIVEGIKPEHRIAQEEIFGPILSVMKAKDYDQAIEWANSTKYALTGAVFSRSPSRLERAARDFAVGNLYLNRNNVGALVDRQPFGGFGLSGIGSKAGGPDYLLQFMDPYVVTENTMRRGFAPIEEGDDWV